jgi:hypothetical protein
MMLFSTHCTCTKIHSNNSFRCPFINVTGSRIIENKNTFEAFLCHQLKQEYILYEAKWKAIIRGENRKILICSFIECTSEKYKIHPSVFLD